MLDGGSLKPRDVRPRMTDKILEFESSEAESLMGGFPPRGLINDPLIPRSLLVENHLTFLSAEMQGSSSDLFRTNWKIVPFADRSIHCPMEQMPGWFEPSATVYSIQK